MQLQLTITLGDLVMAGTFVVSAVTLWVHLAERLARIETMLGPLWTEYQRRHARASLKHS